MAAHIDARVRREHDECRDNDLPCHPNCPVCRAAREAGPKACAICGASDRPLSPWDTGWQCAEGCK